MSRPIWTPPRGLCTCRHSQLDHEGGAGRCRRWVGRGQACTPCACRAYEASVAAPRGRPSPDDGLAEPALRRRHAQRDELTRRAKIKEQRLAALRQWLASHGGRGRRMMQSRTCRDCGELIVYLRAGPDRWMPVDADSVGDPEATEYEPRSGHVNHLDTCVALDLRRGDAKGG